MITFFLCIALFDLGIGYYLGTWLLARPQSPPVIMKNSVPAAENDGLHAPEIAKHITASNELQQSPLLAESPAQPSDPTIATAVHFGVPPKAGWNASGNNLKSDIATINERIRYAFSANDKQLVRDIATELRTRSRLWTTQLQDLLTELNAELEQDPTAKIDCVTPELCLAQIETLQTNLELLDWSDTADSILGKLEREVEAVKKLLPSKINIS